MLAGILLCDRDCLGERLCRKAWMRSDDERRFADQRHRSEVARNVVRDLLSGRRTDDNFARRCDEHRVAIGGTLGDRIGADRSICTGAVLDHERLLQFVR